MTVFVGTSGWQYRDWREAFYPKGLPQGDWIAHYAAAFATVELNVSFYRLPKPETFAKWAARTPADFVMCAKVSRYLSHIRRLRSPAEPVARFLGVVRPLGPKLGPVLLQLPPTFAADLPLLRDALAEFPASVRVAVEVRHASWFTDAAFDVLRERNAALVWADRRSRLITPPERTADWGYVRFHEGVAQPRPCYGRGVLGSRARLLADVYGPDRDVFAYFNNDPRCCAVRDARRFAGAATSAGLAATRVPTAGAVRVWQHAAG